LDDVIAKTVHWIYGGNELKQNMIIEQHGLILRDIHPRGAGRLSRMARAAAWCAGWHTAIRSPGPLVINRECRPYHLGWALYAAGVALRGRRRSDLRMAQETGV
jgi:hypothetical protein